MTRNVIGYLIGKTCKINVMVQDDKTRLWFGQHDASHPEMIILRSSSNHFLVLGGGVDTGLDTHTQRIHPHYVCHFHLCNLLNLACQKWNGNYAPASRERAEYNCRLALGQLSGRRIAKIAFWFCIWPNITSSPCDPSITTTGSRLSLTVRFRVASQKANEHSWHPSLMNMNVLIIDTWTEFFRRRQSL